MMDKSMKPLAKAVWGISKALLAEAPGGKVLGAFADPIFNAVLDSASGSEASLEEVLKRMGSIASEELAEHDIAKLKGTVADIKEWLGSQYKPYVDRKWPDPELHSLLLGQENKYRPTFRETLMQPKWQENGLPVFLLAAPLHLLILQELAMRDPHPAAKRNRLHSAHALSIQKLAVRYAEHVENVTDIVLEKREDAVQPKIKLNLPDSIESRIVAKLPFSEPYAEAVGYDVCTNAFYSTGRYSNYYNFWYDELTGLKGPEHHRRRGPLGSKMSSDWVFEDVKREMRIRREEVRENLDKALGYPKELAKEWRKLKDHPLGIRGGVPQSRELEL